VTWLIILSFAASSSLDNFGVGISYGIRGIRIGFVANFVIAIICFLFSEAGILLGLWLAEILPGILPTLIATFLLFVIGLRIIMLATPRKKLFQGMRVDAVESEVHAQIITGILQSPEIADADKSGDIGFVEAIILGIALSANALTNGLGAGLLGLSPFAISLTTAIGSFVTVWSGVALGRKVAGVRIGSLTLGDVGTVLSGVILITIAVHTFWG
jgi:putative sporulation protein YtaF